MLYYYNNIVVYNTYMYKYAIDIICTCKYILRKAIQTCRCYNIIFMYVLKHDTQYKQ